MVMKADEICGIRSADPREMRRYTVPGQNFHHFHADVSGSKFDIFGLRTRARSRLRAPDRLSAAAATVYHRGMTWISFRYYFRKGVPVPYPEFDLISMSHVLSPPAMGYFVTFTSFSCPDKLPK